MDEEAVADMFGTTKGFVATAVGRNPETEAAPIPDDDSEEDF